MRRAVVLLSLCLASPAAWAHLPHDLVQVLLLPDDFDEVGRGWAVLRVDGASITNTWALLETVDAGAHWDPVGTPPTRAQIVDGAVIDGAGVLLDADTRLWAFDGATWTGFDGPGAPVARGLATAAGRLVISMTDGLRVAESIAGPWRAVGGAAPSLVAFAPGDPERLVAAGPDRRAWLGPPDALRPLPPLPSPPLAVAVDAASVYAGGMDGAWVLAGRGWRACGPLPVGDPDEPYAAVVVALRAEGGVLTVGTGQDVFRSTDGCRTFARLTPFVARSVYGDGPGTGAVGDTWVGLHVTDTVGVVAGFRGIAATADGGATWTEPRLEGAGFTRGLDVAADGVLRATTYGGGLVTSADGGRAWHGSARGLTGVGIYGRSVSAVGEVVAWAGDIDSRISVDGGDRFEPVDLPFDHAYRFLHAAGRLWAFAIPPDPGLAVSADGHTWTLTVPSPDLVRDLVALDLDVGPSVAALVGDPPSAWLTTDAGSTWSPLVDDGAPVWALTSWPPGVGSRLIRATDDGVQLSDDGGPFTSAASPPAPPVWLGTDPSGDVYALDDGGGVWRSEDGGDTWRATGVPLPNPQRLVFTTGPDDTPVLLAPTLAGVWWSDDGAEHWYPLPGVDRLEDPDGEIRCATAAGGTCATWTDDAAGAGGGWRLEAGDTLRLSTRAGRVHLVADGEGVVRVDDAGAARGDVDAGGSIDLPGDGWHDLVLTAEAGPLFVDAVEGLVGGTALPAARQAPAEETGSCGCAGDGEAVAGVPLVGWLLGRRRQRGTSPASPKRATTSGRTPGHRDRVAQPAQTDA